MDYTAYRLKSFIWYLYQRYINDSLFKDPLFHRHPFKNVAPSLKLETPIHIKGYLINDSTPQLNGEVCDFVFTGSANIYL